MDRVRRNFQVGRPDYRSTPAYQGAANLLRLCVLVAEADGTVDENELGVFRQIIESQLHLSRTELKRLAVLERILVQNPEPATKTLTKVAKMIAVDKRMLVGQVLVKVAAVDHVITKTEFQVLEGIQNLRPSPAKALRPDAASLPVTGGANSPGA